MRLIEEILRERFGEAIGLAFGAQNMVDPLIRAGDPKFADYQSNVAMALAKRVGAKPREVADKIVANLKIADVCEKPTIAGPGFINLRLNKEFLVKSLGEAFGDREAARGGVEKVTKPQTVVIDYS